MRTGPGITGDPASPAFLDGQGRLRWGWRLALFLTLLLSLALALLFGLYSVAGAPDLDAAPPDSLDEAILWWSLLIGLAAVGVASWVACRMLESMPVAALGLPVDRSALRELGAGALVGTVAIGAVVGVLATAGWLSWTATGLTASRTVAGTGRITLLLAAAAFAEELLFRGYPFQLLAEGLGGVAAVALTSVAFGLAHAGNPFAAPLPLANITLAGVLLGLAYWRTWSLWFATGLHFAWNWTMGVAAGLPVSGLDLSPGGLEASVAGPELWTGGDFGPEGGLAVTLVTSLAILWLWRTDRVRPCVRVLALRPPPVRRWAAARFPGGGSGGGGRER